MIDPNQSTEALVSDLKRILLNTDTTGRDTFKFTTEGRLIARNSPAVVAFLRKDYITGIEIAGALSYFTDGRNVAMIHYLTTTAGDNVDAMIGIIEHYDFGE